MSDFPPCPDPHSDVHYFDMRLRFEHEFANGVNAKFAPLALVVHSGGKSLHGWAACAGIAEDELRKFMAYACELGADPKTWTASQFVRMPDGLRYDHGQAPRRQHVCFFNPEVIAHD